MNETYEHMNLEGAVFQDVNLHKASFKDVNLAEASIKNANLEGLSIEDANINGMTIFGLRIDQLISDELDRRDPERVRLRMSDPYDPQCVRAVMERLQELRGEFRQALLATDPDLLTARPSPEEWSVLENLRHLVFAEELFINRRILGSSEPWNPLGLLPEFMRNAPEYKEVGGESIASFEAVLVAWDTLHERLRQIVAEATAESLRSKMPNPDYGEGAIGEVLAWLPQHDLQHIRQSERALAALRQS